MPIERRRRPPRKREHPKRRRHKRREKRAHKRKHKRTGAANPPVTTGGGGASGGGGSGESAVVATPDNTGTDQPMDTTQATPATLTGQPPASDTSAGYFSTGPGMAEHYHPVATFINVIAEHTDESTTDAGSTGSVAASSSGTENNPT